MIRCVAVPDMAVRMAVVVGMGVPVVVGMIVIVMIVRMGHGE